MREDTIRHCRTAVTVLSALIFVSLFVIVLIGLSTPGEWVKVTDGNIETEKDGLYVVVESDFTVDSRMPYSLEGLEGELFLIDREKGSEMRLCEISPADIVAYEDSTVHASSRIFSPGLLLILSDMADRPGSVLHFNLRMSCGYLHGLADVHLDMDVDLPLSEPGDRVTVEDRRQSPSEFNLKVSGLAGPLTPPDWEAVFSGGGKTASVSVVSEDGCTALSVVSGGVLEHDLRTISGSADYSAADPDGNRIEVDRQALEWIAYGLEALEGMR